MGIARVSVAQLFDAVEAEGGMPPDLAGYWILALAEHALHTGEEAIWIESDGACKGGEGGIDFIRLSNALRHRLQRLLAGRSEPSLSAIASRSGSLEELAIGLERALVPVNREAGRRALGRLARELSSPPFLEPNEIGDCLDGWADATFSQVDSVRPGSL